MLSCLLQKARKSRHHALAAEERRYNPEGERMEFKIDPMDELKIVQDIITTQEELCFKVFSWAVGLVTALTIGMFHKSIEISSYMYVGCGITIVLGFYIVARHHWHTFSSAVVRSNEIEKEIKNNTYQGVKINYVLNTDQSVGLFGGYKLWLPYLVLSVVLISAGLVKTL